MIGLVIELTIQGIFLAIRLTILLVVWTVRLVAMLIAAIIAFAASRRSSRPAGLAQRRRQPLDPDVRWSVFQRDGYACSVCGAQSDLTVDHINPVVLGGNNDPSNLRTLCRSCNSRKGSRLIGGMTARRLHRWVLPTIAILIGIAVGAFALAPVGAASGAGTTKRDKDCADFATQAQAQSYFAALGPGDPDQLDGDGDGRACEDLPCPCASGGGGVQGGGGNDGGGGGNGAGIAKGHAVVSDIADGDTIAVRLNGRTEDVRLIGIDTPEVYFGAECGGAQASAAMTRILHVGDRVKLIRDRSQDNRDRYDRLLRYVIHAGRDVGRRQIRKGWAKAYVFESPFKRLSSYRDAGRAAKRSNRGVWSMCHANFHQPL